MFVQFLQQLDDPAYVVDEALTVLFSNPAMVQVALKTGDDRDPTGRHLFDAFPFLPKATVDRFREVFRTGRAQSTEELFTLDKTDHHFRSRCLPIHQGDAVARVVTVLEPVPRSPKPASPSPEESENIFREIFLNSPVALWVEDISEVMGYIETLRQEGVRDFATHFERNPEDVVKCAKLLRVLDVNNAAVEMYRADTKQRLLDNITQTFTEESYGAFREGLITIANGRKHIDLETTTKTLDEQVMATAVRWNLVSPDVAPTPTLLVSILDITALREAEAERERAHNLDSLSRFAGGIAHDLNNLLTTIFAYLELIKAYGNFSGRLMTHMDQIDRACIQIQYLGRRLLAFSGSGGLRLESVSLEKLVRDCAEFVFAGTSHTWRIELPEESWQVKADEWQIGQMFHNIAINAREAMPEGGTVVFRVENVENGHDGPAGLKENQRYVKVSVIDTGTGVEEGDLPKIFEPYFSTKQVGTERGMGLGLAICHSIAKLHKGIIGAKSALGRGTEIYLYLPGSLPESPSSEPAPTSPVAEAAVRHILVMDDDQSVLAVIEAMLKHLGCRVDTATDGAGAIARYREAQEQGAPFDLVLLDLVVTGGMGGMEAIDQLHEIDPDVTAVIASGYANDPVLGNYKNHGFAAALPKPYKLHHLEELLKNCFD